MDKISIIVPIYNGEKYLSRCLDSLINQTYDNIEIICINDGSIDNSINILKEYRKKCNKIKIIDKKNTGVSDTRNIGIDKATGKYICFCDCDDMYELNYVEVMYKEIKKHKVSVVKCNYKVIDKDNNFIDKGNVDSICNKKFDKEKIKEFIIPEILNGKIPCFSYLIMIDKKFLNVKYPVDIAMMEDVVFYIKLLSSIDDMYIIDKELYTIMYNELGATNNPKNYKRNILNVITINKYIKNELKNYNCLTKENEIILNNTNLTAISDFVFRFYLAFPKDIINMSKDIVNDDFIDIVDESNLNDINIQRRLIIKLLRNKKYKLLCLFCKLRRIVYMWRHK